jgi:hypothetical protein
MLNTRHFVRGFTRLVVVVGLVLASWTFVFLAVYGAVKLAERFGIC